MHKKKFKKTSSTLRITISNKSPLPLRSTSEKEARQLFNWVPEGGNLVIPLDKVPEGAYLGMFTDQLGVKWMVNYKPSEWKFLCKIQVVLGLPFYINRLIVKCVFKF